MNNTSHANNASRIVVAAHAATSVELPAGAAIHGVGGRLWLTQEGDLRDHVLVAGMTFCTDRAGRVVLSAVDAGAVALVSERAPAHCVPGTVTIDSIRRVTREAELAQARYLSGLFVRAGERLLAALRRIVHPAPLDELRAGLVEGEARARERFRGFVRSL